MKQKAAHILYRQTVKNGRYETSPLKSIFIRFKSQTTHLQKLNHLSERLRGVVVSEDSIFSSRHDIVLLTPRHRVERRSHQPRLILRPCTIAPTKDQIILSQKDIYRSLELRRRRGDGPKGEQLAQCLGLLVSDFYHQDLKEKKLVELDVFESVTLGVWLTLRIDIGPAEVGNLARLWEWLD